MADPIREKGRGAIWKSAGYAVLIEKARHFRKIPGFFSVGQVLVV
jgi:hypothetical protein